MQVEITNGEILVDAALLGELLDVAWEDPDADAGSRHYEHLRKGRRCA